MIIDFKNLFGCDDHVPRHECSDAMKNQSEVDQVKSVRIKKMEKRFYYPRIFHLNLQSGYILKADVFQIQT